MKHPNIVTIYDIDFDAGVDFIAMEHVPERTLTELIPSGGMRADQALKYAAQVAGALRSHLGQPASGAALPGAARQDEPGGLTGGSIASGKFQQ